MEQTEILIIGAGIAGLSLAYRLAENYPNKQIALIDQKSLSKLFDSNHPAVLVEPAFVVGSEKSQIFNQKAYFSALEFYQQFHSDIFHSLGLIKLSNAKHLEKKQAKLKQLLQSNHPVASEFFYLSGRELSKLAGIAISQFGIYYPSAGLLNPAKITEALIEKTQSKIDYFFNHDIQEIKQKNGDWITMANYGKKLIQSKKVIYAGGFDGLKILDCIDSTLSKRFSKTRGQISIINYKKTNYQPKITLSGNGFVSPVLKASQKIGYQHICFGSSWDREFNASKEIKAGDHQQNLIKVNDFIKQPLCDLNTNEIKQLDASVSVRLNGINREPVVFEGKENFWLFTGFGSRGYQYAPFLSAELAKKLGT